MHLKNILLKKFLVTKYYEDWGKNKATECHSSEQFSNIKPKYAISYLGVNTQSLFHKK